MYIRQIFMESYCTIEEIYNGMDNIVIVRDIAIKFVIQMRYILFKFTKTDIVQFYSFLSFSFVYIDKRNNCASGQQRHVLITKLLRLW